MKRFYRFGLLLLATACSPASNQPAESASGESSGQKVAAPAAWDAESFLSRADFATTEWPGKPDWKLISAENRGEQNALILHPNGVKEATETTLRVPLKEGIYSLAADAVLAEKTQFPVDLTISTSDSQTDTVTFQPGERKPLVKQIAIGSPGGHIELRVKMADGATNNWWARLTLENFRFTPASSKN